MIYVNVRAIIERVTDRGVEIVVQTRNRPGEPQQSELPGGQVEPYESLVAALRREVNEETGLTVTAIEGLDTLLEVGHEDELVECIRPFAVYQTRKGPVDSMGVYFRCEATGDPGASGDDAKDARWESVEHVRRQLERDPAAFSWVDRAGLSFYLKGLP